LQKLLIVDDDESLRRMLKIRLSDIYQPIDTGEPAEAVALVLEHKPAAVLLDLMMPNFSGFELCQNLHSLSYTSRIPLFVISGESAARYRDHCCALGARDFFEKPVDFQRLRRRLEEELRAAPVERRAHVRVRLRVPIRLRGTDANGKNFELSTITENVSAGGLLCAGEISNLHNTLVDIYVLAGQEQFAGRARVVRQEVGTAQSHRCGLALLEKTSAWILQSP
jgi:DNA-binding response OmpR family regulator